MNEQPKAAAATDFHDTRPADVRAKANGPWKESQSILDDAHARVVRMMKQLPPLNLGAFKFCDLKQGPLYVAGVDPAKTPDAMAIGLVEKAAARALEAAFTRKHVSDAARKALIERFGNENILMNEGSFRLAGVCVISEDEHDALTANQARNGADSEWRQIAEARQVAMHAASARIAALEAECESLSRQLRSRQINAEPAVTRPAWRWSPLL